MRGDEARARNAVAVEKNTDPTRARKDGEIPDLGEAKAAILVPDMDEALADA
jgi:hypothetical protein